MITKWIQFTVRPDAASAFQAELAALEAASLREDGCAGYAAFAIGGSPGRFAVLESWETEAAFEAHRGAPHTLTFKARCEAMITGKSALALAPVGDTAE